MKLPVRFWWEEVQLAYMLEFNVLYSSSAIVTLLSWYNHDGCVGVKLQKEKGVKMAEQICITVIKLQRGRFQEKGWGGVSHWVGLWIMVVSHWGCLWLEWSKPSLIQGSTLVTVGSASGCVVRWNLTGVCSFELSVAGFDSDSCSVCCHQAASPCCSSRR